MALLVCVAGSGCAAVAVGAAAGIAGVAYARGDLERTYALPMDIVWEATLAALTDLELEIVEREKDQLTAKIKAYTSTDKRIKIKLKSSGNVTDLHLRVNVFGDGELSHSILARIEAYLPDEPFDHPVLLVPDLEPILVPDDLTGQQPAPPTPYKPAR